VVGPAFSVFPGYDKEGVVFEVMDTEGLMLVVTRLSGGEARYEWGTSPEKVLSVIMNAQARERIQREKDSKNNQVTFTGDCMIWRGKRYCTGEMCKKP